MFHYIAPAAVNVTSRATVLFFCRYVPVGRPSWETVDRMWFETPAWSVNTLTERVYVRCWLSTER